MMKFDRVYDEKQDVMDDLESLKRPFSKSEL